MSIIDTLIYDRTSDDVMRVFTFKHKILLEGLASLTAEERTEYFAGMKGAYNAVDMNRVGGAVEYVAERLIDFVDELQAYRDERFVGDDTEFDPIYDRSTIVVTAKQDWAMGDVPTLAEAVTFINDLVCVKGQLPLPEDTPEVPSDLNGLTYRKANDIEEIIAIINTAIDEYEAYMYDKIDRTVLSFVYCNDVYCG